MKITAGLTPYGELNRQVREALETTDTVTLEDVNGQRYIGCGLDAGKTVTIYGTPGNDMACYLNGGRVEVFGNGQDAVGNTMSGGEIVIHGHVGDALGYAMRDGEIYIEQGVSCRGGIHMKEFGKMKPAVVIGGVAGAFMGEYMAGGVIVILGLGKKPEDDLFGSHCATGMHGGKIYLRGAYPEHHVSRNIAVSALNEEDQKELDGYLQKYCAYFGADMEEIKSVPFVKFTPESSRPYGNMYTAN